MNSSTKAPKQTVKILGHTVTVGTKKHAILVEQVKHFDDLASSTSAPAVYEVKDALGWVRAAGLPKQVTENAVEAVQRAYEVAREARPSLPPIWTVKTLRGVIAQVEADLG